MKREEMMKMKKLFSLIVAVLLLFSVAESALAVQDFHPESNDKKKTKDKFDHWGYNYEQRSYQGNTCDYLRSKKDAEFLDCEAINTFENDQLQMNWNEEFLSNYLRDGENLLVRHPNSLTYQGTSAEFSYIRTYIDSFNGFSVTEIAQIKAAPSDAYFDGFSWYDANGNSLGESGGENFSFINEKGILETGLYVFSFVQNLPF
ncbi:hypothetical protein A2313_01600 [Candidatus Roizmanbacteria bacterium RIFOXYB2_FULL_41_10]|uniref:Uncharacterized protein n=1 Tax=Candidatus Roizmanbacteria bacterium RIFOXYA1_FULL_41_12 TaxID=1802082 RepID=A0A1F7KGM4_9BACT|nr:MAG: hypothetical protein A2209_03035 [Candidatus Roizmanbacteria bacterium RIFOXYA1_FULL_41_12]OGK71063.1 MAG: hypothetical protein A2313_01600 [Candidatus Roizmanbacteria bacterium RIFOXYB2_FULL_41_10]OGK71701.1 MAG: hypothetical protein A2403_04555 [Candidatus Roizmanbacteria bacterium RIFOXYC1_FULL_41_16]OGK72950.1 MAG: hypothetical protein A2459_00320 [Candidatus Roizmanbacteria bacterium RIFOXYC2_FULL_41_10]OGK75005.1 MAG: hypothetical protein A2575_03720 [Candidatus Roizmanbacteria ba